MLRCDVFLYVGMLHMQACDALLCEGSCWMGMCRSLQGHMCLPSNPLFTHAGDKLTEADVRLLPTVVRFDAAYATLFKCTR